MDAQPPSVPSRSSSGEGQRPLRLGILTSGGTRRG
jgi:hypothetical protein